MQFTRLHPNDRFIHDNLTYMLSLAPDPFITLPMVIGKLKELLTYKMHYTTEKMLRKICREYNIREAMRYYLDEYDSNLFRLAPELNEDEWVLIDQLKDAEAANMYASRTNLPLYLVHEIIEGEVGEDRKHNSFTKV